jgi:hypothetical protein
MFEDSDIYSDYISKIEDTLHRIVDMFKDLGDSAKGINIGKFLN